MYPQPSTDWKMCIRDRGGNGSITIENASKGIVYSIYKVFDAKVNAEGTSVAYSTKNFVDNPYFEKDSVGNISAKKEAYKTDSNEQLSEGAIEWIKENLSLIHIWKIRLIRRCLKAQSW